MVNRLTWAKRSNLRNLRSKAETLRPPFENPQNRPSFVSTTLALSARLTNMSLLHIFSQSPLSQYLRRYPFTFLSVTRPFLLSNLSQFVSYTPLRLVPFAPLLPGLITHAYLDAPSLPIVDNTLPCSYDPSCSLSYLSYSPCTQFVFVYCTVPLVERDRPSLVGGPQRKGLAPAKKVVNRNRKLENSSIWSRACFVFPSLVHLATLSTHQRFGESV